MGWGACQPSPFCKGGWVREGLPMEGQGAWGILQPKGRVLAPEQEKGPLQPLVDFQPRA